MTIWATEIKDLSTLSVSIKGQLPGLDKELERLVKADDENMVLLYSRRCLEVMITDLCETELKRPRKTEPLKGIIDKLNKEEKVPSNIITSMQHLNSLSAYGAHPKDFDPEQVKPVLNNLIIIIKWYHKYKDAQAFSKPKEEVKDVTTVQEDSKDNNHKPKKGLVLLLSGITLVVVIVVIALFVFDIIGREKEIKELEKSIAVRPFWNESTEQENEFFVNGMTEDIRNNLSKIADLRVFSRGSVEKYRDLQYSTVDIARELDVTYVLEGTAQRIGNQVKIHVQLILAEREDHIWETTFREEIRNVEQVFDIQSQIAQSVADEIKAIITPEEKELIEKTKTTSLTAYDFYQRGKDEYLKYQFDNDDKEALERAEDLYYIALEYDSEFAQAYTGLARVYWNKHYYETYFTEKFLDSVLILTDIALSFDNQLAEAYTIRGDYYKEKGLREKAIKEYDKAIEFNPNEWMAYNGKGWLYIHNEYVKAIDNLHKAAFLNHGSELPDILRFIGWTYYNAGFNEKNKYYAQEALKLDGDSTKYYSLLASWEGWLSNYDKAIEFGEKAYAIDSNNTNILNSLGECYISLGQNEESLKYYKKWIERLKALGNLDIDNMHRIGYAYWINGYKEEAEYYFNEQIRYAKESIELNRNYAILLHAYYDLAGIYAFMGETNKAYENLRIFNQRQTMSSWFVYLVKNDPLFDSIRDEPEFQQIVRDVEAKYQAEHERVRKWLEENDMM